MIKLKIALCLVSFVCSLPVLADPWKNLHQGDNAAQQFLDQLDQKNAKAGPHPFYDGKKPKESNFTSSNLTGNSQSVAHNNPASQMIHESMEKRPQIKIDPQKDPLLIHAQKIVENPLKTIGGKGTQVVEVSQNGKDEILTCEEAGDDSLESCINELKVKVIHKKVTKEKSASFHLTGCKKSHKHYHARSCPALLSQVLQWRRKRFWNRHGGLIDVTSAFKECLQEVISQKSTRCYRCNNPRTTVPVDLKEDQIKKVIIEKGSSGQPSIQGSTHFSHHGRLKTYDLQATIKIIYEEDSYQILPDEWVSNCDRLEERVDQGLCSYDSRICTQGKQTRLIEGIPITRDCWQEKLTYSCAYPAKDDCGPLRARGCAQINSTCKQMIGNPLNGGTCVVYTQTYQCKGKTQTSHQITGGSTPFCLDGHCRDQSYETNDEMMSSLAQLSLLKSMEGKMNSIFKGDEHQCSKHILNFKDCCGSGKGWSKSIGLGGCKAKEKLLHEKRKAKLCHYVGTYCAKKILGKCIKKKSSYCCFGTKLLKAFHEQGRPQINLGWGKPKHPLCRGFTIEEIQKIDFSKLDLREAFEDLMKNYKPEKLQGLGQKVNERLEIIKKGLIPKSQQQPKQRNEQ